MKKFNQIFSGRLDLALCILKDEYPKRFLHQLVSSQLDMDRLDYLRRDSFFTGVSEGVIGSDRIIKMLNVCNDQLVIDVKGIYSIEKFLVSRRLMYWQVYFHKTVISAENLLLMILRRAKYLAGKGQKLFASPSLSFFLENKITGKDFDTELTVNVLDMFSHLDDSDIITSLKVWINHEDRVLSTLCNYLVNRKLFRIEIRNNAFDPSRISGIRNHIKDFFRIDDFDVSFLVVEGQITNYAYNSHDDNIKILLKNGDCLDVAEASDMLNLSVLSKNIKKFFLCYPKGIEVPS